MQQVGLAYARPNKACGTLNCFCMCKHMRVFALCKCFCHLCLGAELPVQVVPQGIESVNGSEVSMGCTSPLVDSGGVMVCNSTDCPSSYLLDGNSPAIDTSSSDWASQLVTVGRILVLRMFCCADIWI